MTRRDHLDGFGAAALLIVTLIFATNALAIKLSTFGFQPVFAAGVRSVIAAAVVWAFMRARGSALMPPPGTTGLASLLAGAFAAEFLFLFLALDITTVTRATIFLNSMPVWFAIAAHVLIPAERLTRMKAAGLALAFAGMAIAVLDHDSQPPGGSLAGDALALLAALFWATITFLSRRATAAGLGAEAQLLWMLVGSAPVFLLLAPAFGPLLRAPGWSSGLALVYQSVVIAGVGFMAWFWLLGRYPPGGVAAFAFLSPVVAIVLGWAVMGDPVGPVVLIAAAMVIGGLFLVNWPRRAPPVQGERRK
jgi:drug/metabolite transporter (DMT)-like permease